MYKLHLILKYLRKRRIAWVSLVAVTLCTAMVLVVISVMGGWLRMFRQQFNQLSGDVVISGKSQLVGFPYYAEMIQRLEQLPEVKAAAPVIRTFGLANIDRQFRQGVYVVGYPPNIGQVNGFTESLHRLHNAPKVDFSLWPDINYQPPRGYSLDTDVREWSGIIVGSGVIGLKKDKQGQIQRPDFIYRAYIGLTVLPIEPESSNVNPAADKAQSFYWIIDDSRTKVHTVDQNTVYVPFKKLQEELLMQERDGLPARTNEVLIALRPGADLQAARNRIAQVVDEVAAEKGLDPYLYPYEVRTWEEVHATFIGAIENEKGLVTILFGIISVVAVFLVFCIFYMIVVEKTRDIGIVKSVGATSAGVAGIFLGYGMAIGLVGAGLGLAVGWLIVRYINELHTWLGRFGIVVWNPEIYLFDSIPNRMNPPEVVVILAIAVVAAVVGALLPAIRAARMHPVEALRWE